MMHIRTLFILSVVFLMCMSSMLMATEETHPFSVLDMLAMDRISDPQTSPCGEWIVFNLRKTDIDANRGRTDIWLVGVDGNGLRQLTKDPSSDFNARWSSCGEFIYFLSTRSGSSQVWKVGQSGEEPIKITDLPLDIGSLIISPAGKHIAVTMDVFPELKSPEETKKQLDKKADSKETGILFDRLFIRHWDTWKDGRRSHLFVLPEEGDEARDLMQGMDADSPSKPFGGPEEIAFTPDGKGLIFTARNAGRKEAWSTDFDLYHVPVDGSKAPVCLTSSNQAWDTGPVFSPDGHTLAYLAMQKPGYESDRFRIVLRSWPDGKDVILTEEWDYSPGSICWAPDGKTIYAVAANRGQVSLFAIDVLSGKANVVMNDGHVRSPSFAGEQIVFGMDSLSSPVELYSIKADRNDFMPITRINADKVAAARMGKYEQFTFKGWNREDVYCYVVEPVDFDASKKYPVAFLIHGGPQGSFGNDFHYRWNPQAYAGAGYACIMVDFHGSVGYGQAFTDSIQGDWGGKPLIDLQKGLEAALERYPWMDGERVAALGASFGGYMINWIAGNWPERFRCLVNHDGNLDERLAYYDTEELWFPEWDHKGTPWTNPEGYEKHNPVNYVKNWKTPMLVIHGALDFRVVETQGMSTFTALQRKGIPSRLLYFPDENHWVLQPHNSILWHKTVISWLDKWCR